MKRRILRVRAATVIDLALFTAVAAVTYPLSLPARAAVSVLLVALCLSSYVEGRRSARRNMVSTFFVSHPHPGCGWERQAPTAEDAARLAREHACSHLDEVTP